MTVGCSDCLYCDKCDCTGVCEDFFPYSQEIIDAEIDELIDKHRLSFLKRFYEMYSEDDE